MEKPNNQTPTLVVVANIIHVGGARALGNCVDAHEGIFRRGKSDVCSPTETTPEEVRCNAKNPPACDRDAGMYAISGTPPLRRGASGGLIPTLIHRDGMYRTPQLGPRRRDGHLDHD